MVVRLEAQRRPLPQLRAEQDDAAHQHERALGAAIDASRADEGAAAQPAAVTPVPEVVPAAAPEASVEAPPAPRPEPKVYGAEKAETWQQITVADLKELPRTGLPPDKGIYTPIAAPEESIGNGGMFTSGTGRRP